MWGTFTAQCDSPSASSPPDRTAPRISNAPHLTTRELEALALVVDGLSNIEIGRLLHISSRTVQGHLVRCMRKFGVANRTQLAVAALRSHLIALHPVDAASEHDPAGCEDATNSGHLAY